MWTVAVIRCAACWHTWEQPMYADDGSTWVCPTCTCAAPARPSTAKPDQGSWPAHLRDDAPYKTCDTCGRKSWSTECRVGTSCGMPQPTGGPCEGHFIETSAGARGA